MRKIKTDEPVFPVVQGNTVEAIGLSHRDYFAANAPDVPEWFPYSDYPKEPEYKINAYGSQVYNSKEEWDLYKNACTDWSIQRLAAWRYRYADAMIAARGGDHE